jgi:hypothetical protein
MNKKIGSDTLLIIPCCAAKSTGGNAIGDYSDPLTDFVSPKCYSEMLTARAKALRALKRDPKFLTNKYEKNRAIQEGPDLGDHSNAGRYYPALARYTGTLYSVLGLKSAIDQAVAAESEPHVLILSALYGPLHPHSEIQNYNLMMSDAPARVWALAFPPFLEEYAKSNGITQICLYLGSATAYYKIAKKAVAGLSSKGLITRAIQYHVVNGSTRNTPFQHGHRLVADLGSRSVAVSPAVNHIEENIL